MPGMELVQWLDKLKNRFHSSQEPTCDPLVSLPWGPIHDLAGDAVQGSNIPHCLHMWKSAGHADAVRDSGDRERRRSPQLKTHGAMISVSWLHRVYLWEASGKSPKLSQEGTPLLSNTNRGYITKEGPPFEIHSTCNVNKSFK